MNAIPIRVLERDIRLWLTYLKHTTIEELSHICEEVEDETCVMLSEGKHVSVAAFEHIEGIVGRIKSKMINTLSKIDNELNEEM